MQRIALVVLLSLPLSVHAGTYVRGDLRHRPRLTFDGRDTAHIQRVVARIDARQEPWASSYAALRGLVDRGGEVDHRTSGWKGKPDKWAVLYGAETRNGQIATARALVVWLWTQGLDPAWKPLPTRPGESTPEGWAKDQAAAARRTIEGMVDDWPCWRGFSVLNRGIVAADSLTMHCVAYDLLAALPNALRGDLSTSERRLGDLASDSALLEVIGEALSAGGAAADAEALASRLHVLPSGKRLVAARAIVCIAEHAEVSPASLRAAVEVLEAQASEDGSVEALAESGQVEALERIASDRGRDERTRLLACEALEAAAPGRAAPMLAALFAEARDRGVRAAARR